ncbi:MAG TPA: peptidoglycan DD-metalloendopeptidase family protein [Gammaproteobacteria bacterium]|nr:peptidoglycan DD-metalloendopeptidase family protein [Gammaproteobacteria bacterium]
MQSVSANTIVTTKQVELSHVNEQIRSLKKTIVQNKAASTSLEQQLKTTELTLGQLGEQITDLTKQLAAQQKMLDTLARTQQITELKLNIQQDALAHQLRAAWQPGSKNALKILLNQENPGTANRHRVYYKTLNEARAVLIRDIQHNLALLQTTVQATKAHQQKLKKLLADKEWQQKRQQRMLYRRQQLITALGSQNQDKQQQIETLITNQNALQDTISRLKQRDITLTGLSFNQLRNKLSWPVEGSLMTSYGSLTDNSSQRSNGIVIKAPMGTPVRAIYAGKVIFADWLRGFGLLIIINHGHQYMSLYARNEAAHVKPGQWVQTGDIIAKTGNSGGYNNPGLYFEVRQNGAPVNPAFWCR